MRGNYHHIDEEYQSFACDVGELRIQPLLELERGYRMAPLLLTHYAPVVQQGYPLPDHTIQPLARCYDAALELALMRGLTYAEGIVRFTRDKAGKPAIAIAHGWTVDETGHVYDPTLARLQHMHPKVQYLGIAFDNDYVLGEADATGYVGLLDGRLEGQGGVYVDPPEMWLSKRHY